MSRHVNAPRSKLTGKSVNHVQRTNQSEVSPPNHHHISKHLPPVPVFFNEPPDLTGWCEGKPGAGRIVAVKSVLYSDGSAKRFYKMADLKKSNRQTRSKKKRAK